MGHFWRRRVTLFFQGLTSPSNDYDVGVHNGNGCNVSGCFTCARVDVNFYDAIYGPVAPAGCADCDGPL